MIHRAAVAAVGAVLVVAAPAAAEPLPSALMPSVKRFGAKGDGRTDDTAAFRRALAAGRSDPDLDYFGRPKALHIPAGVYRLTGTLDWVGCCVRLEGAGAGRTTLKLADAARGFGDRRRPRAVVQTPAGNMSFRQDVRDLTIDTGRRNPGAIALSFNASNVGSVRNVTLRGSGVTGLDMTRQWPGPLLVADTTVEGFRVGVDVDHAEYGPTFERLTLRGQRVAGLRNRANPLAIRDLVSENRVPALSNGGLVALERATLRGGSGGSAVTGDGPLRVRDVAAQGYARAVAGRDGLRVDDAVVNAPSRRLFDGLAPLRLEVRETPRAPGDPSSRWARFRPKAYGDTSTLQQILRAGRATVTFGFGIFFSFRERRVEVPVGVKRIEGLGAVVNGEGITFVVRGGADVAPLVVEGFGYGVGVDQRGGRPVVLRDGNFRYTSSAGAGDLFLEDVGTGPLRVRRGQRLWARQLNIESERTMVVNEGSAWILGMKTERTGTVIDTRQGGRTELLGTLMYPAGRFARDTSAFVVRDGGRAALTYGTSVYCERCGYRWAVTQTRAGATRRLDAQRAGGRLALFTG